MRTEVRVKKSLLLIIYYIKYKMASKGHRVAAHDFLGMVMFSENNEGFRGH